MDLIKKGQINLRNMGNNDCCSNKLNTKNYLLKGTYMIKNL